MRGSLVRRGKKRWALVLDLGYVADPETGTKKRKQKWVTFHGTRKQAGDALTDLAKAVKDHVFVEPSKTTLVEYLRDWLDKAVKPPMRRPATYHVYRNIVECHVAKAPIGTIPLQQLRESDLERYYAEVKGKASSVAVHHAVLHRALRKAMKERLIVASPAADVDNRPRPAKDRAANARAHCWTAAEARRFLDAAKADSPQVAAFCALALDTGARKSELAGLTWSDIDLDGGALTIERQLDAAGVAPTFGPTKTSRARTLALGTDTVVRLRAHKRAQAELKLKNRTTYSDFGLVFAKEAEDLQTPKAALGQPLTSLGDSKFRRVVKAADLRLIKFHGLRHTSATLLLGAGVPVHVVAQRLGHASATMTLNVYAHALPGQQQDAAARLGALLANG